MPRVAVKKIPKVFDLGFQGPRIPIRSSLLTGLAQQILGGLLQNIGLSSFIFRRSKVISFCQVMLLSSNDDVSENNVSAVREGFEPSVAFWATAL
jgi:hypothetical protein